MRPARLGDAANEAGGYHEGKESALPLHRRTTHDLLKMMNAVLPPRLRQTWLERAWMPVALPLALAVIHVVGTTFAARGQDDRASVDAVAVVLLIAGPLALIVRERFPALVAWAVTGITLAYLLREYPYGPVFLALIVSYYNAIMRGQRIHAWLAAFVLYAGHFAGRYALDLEPATWTQVLGVAAWLLLVLVGSELARIRRDQLLENERTQKEEARRRRSEERLRIARELHDVLAHNISLISVQAGSALHVMDRKPEQARIALEAIETASRDAMSELRSVLNILQQPDEAAPRTPSPSIARLDALTSQAKAAGLDVRVEIDGERQPLPQPIDAAAYRIVQEALTNVLRHARASAATVRLRYRDGGLTIEVDDDGIGAAARTNGDGGTGIAGMRERALALGGEIEAGRLPGRGFRITARLPIEAHS
jgi:signal transduction histidine kinase